MGLILVFFIMLIGVLVTVAFFTICERKVMASIQRRKGPTITGLYGLAQAIADGLKLVFKEVVIPTRSNVILFVGAPALVFIISFSVWVFLLFVEFSWRFNTELSILYLYAISSIGVYGIIGAGWASNSKYAFLGSLRSSAQLISYEVSMSLLLLPIALLANSFNLQQIVSVQAQTSWFVIPLLPICIIFFISVLAETNRAPFDLPEAEAEIVAGYNIEYSSMLFALFFLAEYNNMLWLAVIISICFFGGWLFPFNLMLPSLIWLTVKVCVICFLIIKVRANYPRYRYDQLMHLGWKVFLPISISYLLLLSGLLIDF